MYIIYIYTEPVGASDPSYRYYRPNRPMRNRQKPEIPPRGKTKKSKKTRANWDRSTRAI